MNTHFTCIGRRHSAPALPATRADWEKMRKESWLSDMCRRIASGEEKLKAMLPIWTPSCAEFKNNHRAIADALKPLRRLMLDFDEKGVATRRQVGNPPRRRECTQGHARTDYIARRHDSARGPAALLR